MTNSDGAFILPPSVPQFHPNAGRRLCHWILRQCGWRLAGRFPDEPRLVMIAAPHTSWWDGVWAMLFKVAIGVDIRFVAKRELFRGPLGWALNRLGAIPIKRSGADGLVEQTVACFRERPELWFGIAPEGTRRRGLPWKTGFWHIARNAGVPILPVYFDYPSRTIGIGQLFLPGDDMAADLAALQAFYQQFRGSHHDACGLAEGKYPRRD
ncbi:MAG: lysophospholipid acyltransferase family protein [Dokdonella sp.]|uniref:lysophospholipid acyltransferase family protein n=1 Tax=Dokdonella sp. TaxID=2291710 RepID=UPI003262F155